MKKLFIIVGFGGDNVNIILTRHSKQRRKYLPIQKDEDVLPWTKFFIKKFNIGSKKDGIYKIKSLKNMIVLKKKENTFILITIVGFNTINFSERNKFKYSLNYIKKNLNIYFYLDGRAKVCGKVVDGLPVFKKFIYLHFQIPSFTKKCDVLYFNEYTERYFLKNFKSIKY